MNRFITCLCLIISFTIISCVKIDSSPPPNNYTNPLTVNSPNFVSADGAGNVYFTNSGDVIKIALSGTESVIVDTNAWPGCAGEGGYSVSASVKEPSGICVDSIGEIFFADMICSKVYKISVNGIITTYAGNGNIGFSGDGGLATNAEFQYPEDVSIDKQGDLYIADAGNSRIRMVNVKSNIISTVVGNGISGNSGNGGAATSAELSNPEGVRLDDSGNIYIADCGNNLVKKVNTKGIINIVAGNGQNVYNGDNINALSASINPGSIAIDSKQNIYISDYYNSRIRMVNSSTGIITTIAGNGTAGYLSDGVMATATEISYPEGICLDQSNNIYFCDFGNNRVRKVNASTGIITTVAH